MTSFPVLSAQKPPSNAAFVKEDVQSDGPGNLYPVLWEKSVSVCVCLSVCTSDSLCVSISLSFFLPSLSPSSLLFTLWLSFLQDPISLRCGVSWIPVEQDDTVLIYPYGALACLQIHCWRMWSLYKGHKGNLVLIDAFASQGMLNVQHPGGDVTPLFGWGRTNWNWSWGTRFQSQTTLLQQKVVFQGIYSKSLCLWFSFQEPLRERGPFLMWHFPTQEHNPFLARSPWPFYPIP